MLVRKLIYFLLVAGSAICGCKNADKRIEPKGSPDYEAARKYYYVNLDSTYYFFDRVLQNSKSNVEKGAAYQMMAWRELNAGDYYSAQESLLSSVKLLNENDSSNYPAISSTYNTLANVVLELKEYDTAISYYQHSSKFSSEPDFKIIIASNIGLAYQKKGDYNKSIAIYDSLMLLPISNTLLKARIISNLARTKWLADSSYNALPEYMTALALRKAIKDSLGMNASFAHLTDYYTKLRPDSGLYYATKRYEIVQLLPDPTDKIEVLRQLMILDAPKRKEYAAQYFSLEDSLNTARSSDRKQYARIKFGVEKSKEENFALQQHITKQRLLMYGLIALAVAIIAGLWSWYRKRRKKQKEEAEKEIQESRLKTSKKVHDVVANGLYTIINELEHGKTIEKELLLTRIEGLYEKSRNISYEDGPAEYANYDSQVHQLLNSFANEQTNVFIVGNQQAFWSRITALQKKELLLILNEMMVNMKKHSGAKNAVVTFKQEDNKGFIHYKDDGKGFPTGFEFGNGLGNTVSRIKSIKGEINFGKSEKNGASVMLSFPLEPSNI